MTRKILNIACAVLLALSGCALAWRAATVPSAVSAADARLADAEKGAAEAREASEAAEADNEAHGKSHSAATDGNDLAAAQTALASSSIDDATRKLEEERVESLCGSATVWPGSTADRPLSWTCVTMVSFDGDAIPVAFVGYDSKGKAVSVVSASYDAATRTFAGIETRGVSYDG